MHHRGLSRGNGGTAANLEIGGDQLSRGRRASARAGGRGPAGGVVEVVVEEVLLAVMNLGVELW